MNRCKPENSVLYFVLKDFFSSRGATQTCSRKDSLHVNNNIKCTITVSLSTDFFRPFMPAGVKQAILSEGLIKSPAASCRHMMNDRWFPLQGCPACDSRGGRAGICLQAQWNINIKGDKREGRRRRRMLGMVLLLWWVAWRIWGSRNQTEAQISEDYIMVIISQK